MMRKYFDRIFQITTSFPEIQALMQGMLLFVLNTLQYTRRQDFEFKFCDSENIFIEINLTDQKSVILE